MNSDHGNGLLKEHIPLPNLLVLGAQKCGTTTLCSLLAQHPEICFGRGKEIHYFSIDAVWDLGDEYYLSHFTDYIPTQHKIVAEGSTSLTLLSPDLNTHPIKSAQRVREKLPECQFIFIVRDPYKRIISACNHYKLGGQINSETSFHDAIRDRKDLVESTKYYSCLKPYLDLYEDRDRFFVLSLEDLTGTYPQLLSSIFSFLDIAPAEIPLVSKNSKVYVDSMPAWMRTVYRPRLRRLIRRFMPTSLKALAKQAIVAPTAPPPITKEDFDYLSGELSEDLELFRAQFPSTPNYLVSYEEWLGQA